MSDQKTIDCSICGRAIATASALSGVCPHCMLQGGKLALDKESATASPGSGVEMEGKIIGNYVLGATLGEGGFGIVYRAEQTEPVHRDVAFKLIKPGMDTREVVARFEAERQALALMEHPNVATVFDGGTTPDGRPYFVMELVDGEAITSYCDRHQLEIGERLRLVLDICSAVQHAHQKGIVHRDLKPSNVLVAERASEGEAALKVIDFGVAKAISSESLEKTIFTRQGSLIGTPEYMSPEQAGAMGGDVDTRSDIYSLGVLLYELLTGVTPLDPKSVRGAGYAEMERLICEEEATKPSTRISTLEKAATTVAVRRATVPSQLARAIRGDLDWIVLKAIAKDRERRYQTVGALAADLRRHLNDEPVLAKPAGAGYEIGKFVRRHRGSLAAAASVFAVLIAGIVATSWQAIRATRAQSESEHQRYMAEMNLAGHAIGRPESTRRIQELVSHWSDNEHRGWEWHFLSALSEQSLSVLRGHDGQVSALEWSPDRRQIVSGGSDGTLRLWDPDGGREIRILGRHDGEIRAVAWSPDGELVSSAGADGWVRLWDLKSGKMAGEFPAGGEQALGALAWHPDGRQFAAAGTGFLGIWDTNAEEPIRTFDIPPGSDLRVLFWDPNGMRLSAAWLRSGAGIEMVYQLRSWEAESGQELVNKTISLGQTRLKSGRDRVHSEASSWSLDGSRIALPVRTFRGRGWESDPDEQVGTGNVSLQLLDGDGIKVGGVFDGVTGVVQALDWSPDGKRVVTAGSDHAVSVWKADSGGGGALEFFLRGHHGTVTAVRWSPDGSRIASAGVDGTIRIWDPNRPGEIRTFWEGRTASRGVIAGSSLAWSPEGSHLAVVGAEVADDLYIWNAATGRATFEIRDPSQRMRRADWHPGGSRIATAGMEGTIKIWEIPASRKGPFGDPDREPVDIPEHRLIVAKPGRNLPVSFNPQGNVLASADPDGTVRLWDADSGHQIRECSGHRDWVESLSWSPDGQQIASGGHDGTIRIWDARSGQERLVLSGHLMAVFTVDWHPDGRRLASVGQNGTIRIWDTETGKETIKLFGHTAPVRGMEWSPDGRRLATGGHDQTLRIWDPDEGVELVALTWPGLVSARYLSWSPGGRRIGFVDRNGAVQVLDASASMER